MNQTLLVLQKEHSEIKSIAIAIKYCYKKIMFNQDNCWVYTTYLEQFLENQSPKEFYNTFKQLRTFSYVQDSWNWLDINESLLISLSPINPVSFWSWLVCHPNGYVREFALKKISATSNSKSLPFLLVSLNDHIGNVRKLAEYEIIRTFRQENKATILFSLPLIKRLKELEHKENLDVYNRLNTILLNQFDLLEKAQ
ncbi:hypothetical protein [Enterococcus sp. AZ177]|uniref:hypothetical protein n=1 Tax=unclassified Enterococcus TaxID=2608891 RepID=UPI003D2FCD07